MFKIVMKECDLGIPLPNQSRCNRRCGIEEYAFAKQYSFHNKSKNRKVELVFVLSHI